MLEGTSLNVVKLSLLLVTRPNYLAVVTRVLPGQMANTSVNGHVGRIVAKVLEMPRDHYVTDDEKRRLVALENETRGRVYFKICPWYDTEEGCRFGHACTNFHVEEGEQLLPEEEGGEETETSTMD